MTEPIELPDQIKISMYEAWTEEMREHQSRVLLARAYHDGNQPLALTDRQKKFLALNPDTRFCLNVCRIVVTALTDELTVLGFDTNEPQNQDGKKEQAEFFWNVWLGSKLDMFQNEAHEGAVRDGEYFLLLDWDEEKKLPVIVLHEAWTDAQVNAWEYSDAGVTTDMVDEAVGTGAGVYVKYRNNDISQPMEFAVQYFYSDMLDTKGDVVQVHRRTIYYPDRIEREYMGDSGKWEEFAEPQAWKAKDGKPLGIPAVHFTNKGQRPEAWDAFPPQDAVNKTYADILASCDFFGFPVMWMWGMYPTTDGKAPADDGSNLLYLQPGQINGNANKTKEDVGVDKWEGSDPTPLMNTLKDQIIFIAQITGTPANLFITSAQIASAETLKEQKDALKKRAMNRQVSFGDSWESAMQIARRINNAFGSKQYDELVTVETVWKMIETIEDLREHKEFGVPDETLWARLGYSAEKIVEMKRTPAFRLAFLKSFWESYAAASLSGVTVENFARMAGLTDDEIKLLAPVSDTTPPTEV